MLNSFARESSENIVKNRLLLQKSYFLGSSLKVTAITIILFKTARRN